jgi:hypothetical protein
MSIDYQVIEQGGAIIDPNSPYSGYFFTTNRLPTDTAYLTIDALTGYDTNHADESAQILVNGTTVGYIWPTYADPGANDPYLGTEMTFPFPNSVLTLVPLVPAINVLQIVPIVPDPNNPDPYNYVIVGTITCTYKQS